MRLIFLRADADSLKLAAEMKSFVFDERKVSFLSPTFNWIDSSFGANTCAKYGKSDFMQRDGCYCLTFFGIQICFPE